MISTEMIVLTKQPYRESALLLNGFSPDFGKTSLVAHGAMKLSEKNFPEADLFRELSVEFNEERPGDLFSARRMELIASYDGVALGKRNPESFTQRNYRGVVRQRPQGSRENNPLGRDFPEIRLYRKFRTVQAEFSRARQPAAGRHEIRHDASLDDGTERKRKPVSRRFRSKALPFASRAPISH